MNTLELLEYLVDSAASNVFIFGIVRGTEVIAFGTKNPDGTKTRLGSITIQDESIGYKFLVLLMDSSKEFRTSDHCDLQWFLWALSIGISWDNAEDWVSGDYELRYIQSVRDTAEFRQTL